MAMKYLRRDHHNPIKLSFVIQSNFALVKRTLGVLKGNECNLASLYFLTERLHY